MWEHQGYATHNRELVKRLLPLIPSMTIFPTTGFPENPEPLHVELRKRAIFGPPPQVPDLAIQCTPTTPYRIESKFLVLLTTIESRKAHPGIPLRMQLADEIWLPCRQNARALPHWLRAQKTLKIMPEGIDPDVFYPLDPPPRQYRAAEKLYTFHGDCSHRKGIQYLIPAWCNVKDQLPGAHLLLITKHGMCTEPEAVQRLIAWIHSLVPPGTSINDNRIYLITHTIPDRQLNEIYNQTYCGVLPSLGEAWSLFPCQLAAAGRPVITTAYGGHLEYLNYWNSFLISVDHFGEISPGTKSGVDFYNYVDFPHPDQTHLEKLFVFTYNHPEHVERKAARVMHRVRSRFTWDSAANKVYRRIVELCRRI
jgi:glycosyltransferase involved in cell wall biosynthesis